MPVYKCYIVNYRTSGTNVNVQFLLIDSTATQNYTLSTNIPVVYSDTPASIKAQVESAITTQCGIDGVPTPSSFVWLWDGVPTPPKSFTYPSRSLDSAFQISASNDALVAYTVQVVSNLSLSGGQLGSVVLEYADDSGMSTNVVSVSEMGGGNTGTLTIGLNTNDTTKTALAGIIPAGKYVRLRSVDTTGTPTQTSVRAQEVLL